MSEITTQRLWAGAFQYETLLSTLSPGTVIKILFFCTVDCQKGVLTKPGKLSLDTAIVNR